MSIQIHSNAEEKFSSFRRLMALFSILSGLILLAVFFLPVMASAASRDRGLSRRLLAPNAVDLSILKTHVGNFVIGTPGTYTIVVNNIGADTATGQVTVTDNLPNGLTPTQASGVNWDCNISGQLLTCVYPNLSGIPPSTSLPPIVVQVNVGQAAAPQVTNVANLSVPGDSNLANNSSSDLTIVESADLAVSKAVSSALPSEGDLITYTITLRNNGPSMATGVILTDTLPGGLTFMSANTLVGTYDPTTGAWAVGNLAVNQEITLTLSAQVNAGTRGLNIVNATNGLRSDLYDYNSTNNTAGAGLRVKSTRLVGQVTTLGTTQPLITATLVLTDSLNRVYTTTTAASGWYTFTDTVSTPIATGNAKVKASKVGYQSLTKTINLVNNVDNRLDFQLGTTDLIIGKVDGRTTVVPGQTITYTITITNLGTIAATGVVITDVLPTTLSYVSDTSGIGHTVPTAGTFVWKLTDPLLPNEHKFFKLRVRVADALPSPTTSIKNIAKVGSKSPEANQANNTAEDTNTSTGTHNVTITLSVSPTQVRTGQNATYTISVRNSGTAPVTDTKVEDTFSSFLDIVSATSTKGDETINRTARKVTVDIGVLGANETVNITVVTRVNTTATSNTTVSNTASVSYKFGGQTFSKTSNTASFQLIYSSVLPGTGGVEPKRLLDNENNRTHLPALISAVLLGLIGFIGIGYGLLGRRDQPEWARWSMKMGVMFISIALLFGLVAWGLRSITSTRGRSDIPMALKSTMSGKATPTFAEDPEWVGVLPTQEPKTLPDYPIPTPTVLLTPDVEGNPPDTSPVVRMVIPALGVDAVVKYVPYDGLTWLIAGLRQEVAWMGNTSWPGLGGNTGFSGHVTLRDGTDGPFRHLDLLQAGDEIIVYTENNIYTYKVRDKQVVSEAEMSVLEPRDQAQITLITCTNWDATAGFYRERLVVFAELENVKSMREVRGN